MSHSRDGASFLRTSAFLFVVINSGSLFSFLFQWAVHKKLPDNDAIGAMNTLLAFVAYLVIPGQGLQLVASRLSARARVTGDATLLPQLWRSAWVLIFTLTLSYSLVLAIGANYFIEKFKFESAWSLIAVVILALVHLPWFLGIGLIQGQQRFVPFGYFQALPYWLKCVFGISAVLLGFQATGILVGLVAAHVVPGLAIYLYLRTALRTPPAASQRVKETGTSAERPDEKHLGSRPTPMRLALEVAPLLLNFGAFNLLATADVPFVRATFAGSEGGLDGQYTAAATLARTVFYLPLALVHITFARVAEAQAAGTAHRHLLWKSLGLTSGLAGVGALILFCFPQEILLFFGGEKLVAAAPLLRWYLLPSGLLGIIAVFMHYYFALGARSYAVVILAGTCAAIMTFRHWHDTPLDIIHGLSIVCAALVVVSVLLLPILGKQQLKSVAPDVGNASL